MSVAIMEEAIPNRSRDNDDLDSEVDSEDFLEDVQLGFIEDDDEEDKQLFNKANWREWDGGKVGGLPVWLDPEHVPPVDGLRCGGCNEPMAFLLQIYSPLDHPEGGSESKNTAFHRALYVFCCKKAKCIEAHNPTKSTIRCIRSQLPRNNSYYPSVNTISDEESKVWTENRSNLLSKACGICGLSAPFSCSVCHLARYCSKAHQKLDWSYTIKGIDGSTSKGGHKFSCNHEFHSCLAAEHVNVHFPEHEVRIRNEVEEYEYMKEELQAEDARFLAMADAEQSAKDSANAERDNAKVKTKVGKAESVSTSVAVDDEEALVDSILSKTDEADISQRDLQLLSGRVDLKKYLAAKEQGVEKGKNNANGSALDASQGLDDHVYNKFQLHMKKSNNAQVLRYNRWPENPADGALRVSSNSYVLAGSAPAESRSKLEAPAALTTLIPSSVGLEIPRCRYCGSESKFEFQILPQMIYYLRTDRATTIGAAAAAKSANEAKEKWAQNSKGEDVDWGSVDIYTCSASCQDRCTYYGASCGGGENDQVAEETAYKHEFVVMQAPPPLQYL